MKKLFLDDIRQPKDCTYMPYNKSEYLSDDWDIVRNYDEFYEYIKNCKTPADLPYLISFDHDLADEHYTPEVFHDDYILSKEYQDNKRNQYKEKTGEDCALFLKNRLLKILKPEDKQYIPKFLVHSMNPIGADRIRYVLSDFEKEFERQSFRDRLIQQPFIPGEVFKSGLLDPIHTIHKYPYTGPTYIPAVETTQQSQSEELGKIVVKPRRTGLSPFQQSQEIIKDYLQPENYTQSFNEYLKEAKEREYKSMQTSSSFFDKIKKKFK